MQTFDQFHDGFFDGVWTDSERVQICLRTVDNERFTATIDGIVALNVSGFRAGNIIFDVSVLNHSEVTPEHIEELYELPETDAGDKHRTKLLEDVSTKKLMLLQISPSYGASCVALGRAVNLVENTPSLS